MGNNMAKEVTNKDLAKSINSLILSTKDLTKLIDNLALSTAKGFEKVFDKLEQHDKKFIQHDKAFEIMLREMQGFNKEAHDHRMTMTSLNHSDVFQEREIEGLKIRIEKLEEKVK